jgi:ABC-2 type transport system permease protein
LNYVYRPVEEYNGFSLIMENLQVLHSILFILPVIAIILTVISLSWERSSGTLRTLLSRPISRENVIIGKFLSLFCIVCSLYYLTLLFTVLLGLRWGYGGEFMSFFPRIVLIFFEYVLGTMIFVSLACLIAGAVFNPLLTLLLSVGLHRAILVIESFTEVKPYLFSYHIYLLSELLNARAIDYSGLFESQIVVLVYLLGIMVVVTTLWEKRDLRV